jgi:3-oxoacyl-[acyl-carrier-protein] synthase II
MAIGDAARLIRSGDADVVVAGGSEGGLTDHDGLGLMGFDVLHCLSTRNDDAARASRPFEATRDGFVLGEGCGIVVLESEAHARARGARGYAEIAAYEVTSDAYSMVQPDPEGRHMQRVIRRAITRAGLSPADIDLISAHGTATEVGDIAEATSVRGVFGTGSGAPLVTATKSTTGHAISGSGAFETIATALAIQRGIIPPTANLDIVGEGCELSHVRGEPARRPVRAALKQSFAFGGHAAVLALKAIS